VSNSLTHAMSTIASQNRNLKQFVTYASHELKTPLMTISSSVDVMDRSGIDVPQIQMIKNTTISMKLLIDHLMMTMHHDTLQSQKLDLTRLIDQTMVRIADNYDTSKYTIDTQNQADIIKYTDPVACESIITNLIDNAYKYATPHSTIMIVANDSQLLVSNQIASDQIVDLEQIREPFYRADESRADGMSHGL